eukprot:CAMPEP_0172613974 /NCGR_PEP_ID=MMETSP1068-20121228/49108_1 /TAXON_ID=35684 /ORGANISM="Pseudopedinella elastica, Strain CCMP716" /LENGTH=300 /DNA_ID=CAMNT_0013418617 /DNA_START=129 /DNA_END=1028 /DNA_ORIENTATION=-
MAVRERKRERKLSRRKEARVEERREARKHRDEPETVGYSNVKDMQEESQPISYKVTEYKVEKRAEKTEKKRLRELQRKQERLEQRKHMTFAESVYSAVFGPPSPAPSRLQARMELLEERKRKREIGRQNQRKTLRSGSNSSTIVSSGGKQFDGPLESPQSQLPQPTFVELDGELRNSGESCHETCGGKDGQCPDFCGSAGSCCRYGWGADEESCQFGKSGRPGGHTCVRSESNHATNLVGGQAGRALASADNRALAVDTAGMLTTLLVALVTPARSKGTLAFMDQQLELGNLGQARVAPG